MYSIKISFLNFNSNHELLDPLTGGGLIPPWNQPNLEEDSMKLDEILSEIRKLNNIRDPDIRLIEAMV